MSVKILDGGAATELERMGHSSLIHDGLFGSSLLLEQPSAIKELHKRFLHAGADIVETVTYQASVERLKQCAGLSTAEAVKVIQLGCSIALDACREFAEENKLARMPLVAASVGSYGAHLHDGSEYTGTYAEKMTMQEIMDVHRPQFSAFSSMNISHLAVETQPSQKEAEAIVELLKDYPNMKASISFGCKDPIHIWHGERFSDAIRSVVGSDQVIAVGVNCTDPRHITSLLSELESQHIEKPILVKPNSGENYVFGKGFCGERITSWNSLVQEWYSHGARWIGGCCMVFPDDIKAIKDSLLTIEGTQ